MSETTGWYGRGGRLPTPLDFEPGGPLSVEREPWQMVVWTQRYIQQMYGEPHNDESPPTR